jgi:hypothetical protein
MSQPNQESPLPPHIERELAGWDLAVPSAEEFEAMAEAIERRIEGISPSRGDDGDWLFRSPLPLVNGERVLQGDEELDGILEPVAAVPRRQTAPDSDHLSLKEIAEAAMSSVEDSAQPAGRTPSQFRTPSQSGIHLIAIAGTATAPGESMRPRDAKPGPAVAKPLSQARSNVNAAPASTRPSRFSRNLFALSGALAVAAAVALWLSDPGSSTKAGPANAARGAAPTHVQASEHTPKETKAAPAHPALAAPAHKETAAKGIDPGELPAEPARRVTSSSGARPASPESAVKPETPVVGSSPAAPAEPRLVPAAELASQPKHPSLGAAQAAVGSTLGSARLCLVGQLSPSQATVNFASNGRVASVRVSGPAAGTPAEECIQRAMAPARVQPFTDESFSVKTTVRP